MKKVLIAMLAAAVLSGTVSAMAEPGGQGRGGHGFGHHNGLFKALIRLDLNDLQKHEIALVLKKYWEAGKEKHEAMHQAREGLRVASDMEVVDETAVREAFKAVAAAGEEMAVHKALLVAELRGVLTPEQQEVLREHRHGMGKRMKSRMAQGGGFLDEWIEVHSNKENVQ